jgi:peptide/nickel transport system permease protein
MASFLAERLGLLLATLVAASIVIFVFTEILPGDPASFMLGLNAEPDTLAAVRHTLGLDQPPIAHYFAWIAGMAHGDFGVSYTYRVPVAELIADRLWVSLPLAVFALALAVAIGIPVGVIAATRRNSPADIAVMGATQIGIAVPNFWFAMLMVLLFSVTLHWFSAGGFPGWDSGILTGLRALLLPALALALPEASILARVMRSSLLDTLGEDYVRTARAKGLTRAAAIRRHALRNALIPVTTIVGLQFSFLLAGAIVIENVFFLPGIGRLIYQAVTQRDLIVVQSVVMLLVAAVVAVTFAVDVVYALIDPRLRRPTR